MTTAQRERSAEVYFFVWFHNMVERYGLPVTINLFNVYTEMFGCDIIVMHSILMQFMMEQVARPTMHDQIVGLKLLGITTKKIGEWVGVAQITAKVADIHKYPISAALPNKAERIELIKFVHGLIQHGGNLC